MKTMLKFYLIILILTAICGSAFASNYLTGTTQGTYLKWNSGVRSSALGGAFIAAADDSSAIFWNPAGLTQISSFEMSTTYSNWLEQISFSNISFVVPLQKLTLGLSANYVNFGVISETTALNPAGTGRTLNPQANDLIFSFSKKILPKLFIGGNFKIANENYSGVQNTIYCEDLGALYKVSEIFSLGASGRNIASPQGGEKIPKNYGIGFSLKLDKLLLLGDLNIPNDNKPHANFGAEFNYKNNIFLRAGYNTRQEENAGGHITAGIGLVLKNMKIDYSFVPYEDLGITHRFGITISKS